MIECTIEIENQRKQTQLLFETWKNLFVKNVRNMSSIDLLEHYISTYVNAISMIAKSMLYIAKKIQWQKKNILALIETKIIASCLSSWSVKIRFSRKSNEALRMIHVFCQLNDVTIKSNYSMRRIELILRKAAQDWLKHFFQANVANEFWAIKIYRSHVYKLDFSAYNDHYCYLRMSQEIINDSETYSRLKNIVIETISSLSSKSSLSNAHSRIFFNHFVDDDVDEAIIFESLLNFLHNHYFSRLAWAKLTLNLKKCKFFVARIQILKHQRDVIDIRSSKDKLKIFRKWSSLTSKKELNRFLHMFSFLKNYILERANRTTLLKTTIIEKITSTIMNEKKRITRKIKNFL